MHDRYMSAAGTRSRQTGALVMEVAQSASVPIIGNGDILTHYEVCFCCYWDEKASMQACKGPPCGLVVSEQERAKRAEGLQLLLRRRGGDPRRAAAWRRWWAGAPSSGAQLRPHPSGRWPSDSMAVYPAPLSSLCTT